MPLIYRPEELRQERKKNKKGLNAIREPNSNDFPLGTYFGNRYEPTDRFVTDKQPGILNTRNAVCAFVDRGFLIPPPPTNPNGNWRINPVAAPTLAGNVRDELASQIEDKKNELMQSMVPAVTQVTPPTPPNPAEVAVWNNARTQLDALRWPQVHNPAFEVNVPYANDHIVAAATGFHIGHGLVVTAGHITRRSIDKPIPAVPAIPATATTPAVPGVAANPWGAQCTQWMASTYLIFGLYGDLGNLQIPNANVYEVERVIMHNYRPTAATLSRDLFGERRDIEAEARANDIVDCGILKVRRVRLPPAGEATVLPPSLKLSPIVPKAPDSNLYNNPPVYLAGHGCSLSQKISWGGHIIKSPSGGANTGQTFPKHSIIVDLDSLKGNSGGPVLLASRPGQTAPNANDDLVVGIVASGDTCPFATSADGSNVKNFLLDDVNSWLVGKTPRRRLDNNGQWQDLDGPIGPGGVNGPAGPNQTRIMNNRANLTADTEWLNSYTEMQIYDNGQKVAYQRFSNEGPQCQNLDQYTRTDYFQYFTAPLRQFLPPTPLVRARPYGKIVITVNVPFVGTGAWAGGVSLKIDDSQVAPVAATTPTGAGQAPTANVPKVWTLDTTPNTTASTLTLSNALLDGPIGLAGWKTLQIVRVAPTGTPAWSYGQLAPTTGAITAKFEITEKSDDTTGFPAWKVGTTFTFTAALNFSRDFGPGAGDSWTAKLGKTRSGLFGENANAQMWKGPIES